MMSVLDFITAVYILVDDLMLTVLRGVRLRRRGVAPKLSDSEVVTMEIVGEVLQIDEDKRLYNYFRQHWQSLFPGLGSRSAFVRQAANLWHVKQLVHHALIELLAVVASTVHIIDAFPIRVCRKARSNRCRVFKGEAAKSYCASQKEYYYGFKGHLLVNDEGLIQSLLLTAANVDDRDPLLGLSATIQGVLIGDKGYIDLQKWQWLWQFGVQLKTPIRKNMAPRPAATASKGQKRRRKIVETVISQLEQRFNIGTVKARDSWHLTNRITRKVLAHTVLCAFNYILDREPLHHDGLVAIS